MKTRTVRKNKGLRRGKRVAFKIRSRNERPILYVFRSNRYIYAQILDLSGKSLMGVSSRSLVPAQDSKGKIKVSFETGKALAQKAKKNNITQVVFNRGGYKYHGRVKALAEGAREGGLKF